MASLLIVAISVPGLLAAGCDRRTLPFAAPVISMHLPTGPADRAVVEVNGLTADELSAVRDGQLSVERWQAFLKITVAEGGSPDAIPAVQGAYAVTGDRIVFTPLFPFDPGRAYHVRLDPRQLPSGTGAQVATAVVRLPAIATVPTTVVTAVHPDAPVVPENLLRMYLEFSAPMGNGVARDFVRILDQEGREVAMPFLPLETPLWNGDRTRCTVLFDPGRVKQGILPNEELGRPLRAGRTYVLEVSTAWLDANGLPLKSVFRHEFQTGPEDAQALAPSSWQVLTPKAGGRDPLVVAFNKPLDHALLNRALGVQTRDRLLLEGDITLEEHDTRWSFRPALPWKGGDYDLVALSILEDPAGNRIGRPFEADLRGPNVEPAADEHRIPFTVPRVIGTSR